jgi:hypothetical protein
MEKKKEFFSKTEILIVTIENSEEFLAEEYDNARVITGESLIKWKSISYTQRQRYNN